MASQSTIDIRKLRHMVELARFRNFTRAAESLGLTQSALSRSIIEIETEMGVKLFTRHSKGVNITDIGEVVIRRSEELLDSFDDILSAPARSVRALARHFKVGVLPASYQAMVRIPIADFAAKHPEVSIQVLTGQSDELTWQLESGQLDLIIGYGNWLRRWESVFLVRTVATMHQAILVRKGHPLGLLDTVTDRDVVSYPCILPASMYTEHQEINEVFSAHKVKPSPVRYNTDDFQMMLSLVDATDAFLPLVQASPRFEKLRQNFLILSDVEIMPQQDLATARLPHGSKDDLLKSFLTCLTTFFDEQQG